MAVLFVSHSSLDDPIVTALAKWLRANGFTDIFVDHEGLAAGDKWRAELRASAGACRVVVCLVSGNWLNSDECFNEFRAAWYMGKRIIPLFLLPPTEDLDADAKKRFAEVCAEDQGLDLRACLKQDGTLDIDKDPSVAARLNTGLRGVGALNRVGVDSEAFAIDRKARPTPFPGLASFGDDDADAALFYGRNRDIAQALEELRKVRAERDLRPFVILGASGAGKSSLLKAGIIPRLRREAPAWLPLRAFRPGADPLLNFAEALARSFADFGGVEAYGVIRDRLLASWKNAERNDNRLTAAGQAVLEKALDAEGRRLQALAGRSNATILISVDQAEEMARADGDSGEALSDYLRAALMASTMSWQLAMTIRTDSFPELQKHRRFQNLEARGYDLRAIPVFRFDSVVEEPSKRYGVTVDAALVDALMEDAPKEDALPLLAFALQRLWRQYSASGALTKDNYDKVGGLRGLIEDAAERALRGISPDEDIALPASPPSKRRLDLVASTFVPGLAQVNDQGATVRRIAAWSEFNEEQQELLTRFDQWRLVVRKGEAEDSTVEVAHEALFREWTRLKIWLEPERVRLDTLRSVTNAADIWDRHRRAKVWLDHRGQRLRAALALINEPRYQHQLGRPQKDYLKACASAGRARTLRVSAVVLIFLVAAIAAPIAADNRLTFDRLLTEVDQLNQRADFADQGYDYQKAVRFAVAALPGAALFDWGNTRDCVGVTLSASECALRRTGFVEPSLDQPPAPDKLEIKYDYGNPSQVIVHRPGKTQVQIPLTDNPSSSAGDFSDRTRVEADPTLARLVVIYPDKAPVLWDIDRQQQVGGLPGYSFGTQSSQQDSHNKPRIDVNFSTDGSRFLTTMQGQPTRLWDASDGHQLKAFKSYAQFVSDTSSILAGPELWDTKTVTSIATFDTSSFVRANDAKTKAGSIVKDGSLKIWDMRDGRLNSTLPAQAKPFSDFWTNSSGSLVVTLAKATFDKEGSLAFWDAKAAKQLAGVDKLSTNAFFYHPEPGFANGLDRSALWTDDYRIIGWNGQKTVQNPGISNTQIGSTGWFSLDAGQKPKFSADGTRVLAQRANSIAVLDAESFLPVSILRTPSSESQPLASFENGDATQVRAGDSVWKLAEAGRLHKQQLREWMCSDTRLKGSKIPMALTDVERKLSYLGGRPADICSWAGLETARGWQQLIYRLWFVVSGRDLYSKS